MCIAAKYNSQSVHFPNIPGKTTKTAEQTSLNFLSFETGDPYHACTWPCHLDDFVDVKEVGKSTNIQSDDV